MRSLTAALSVFACLFTPLDSARADNLGIIWSQTEVRTAARRGIAEKYRADLFVAPVNFAAFLANPFSETVIQGAAQVFEPQTRFAVFKDIPQRDKPENVLALTETGYWVFVRLADLEQVDREDAAFEAARAHFASLNRYMPLRNNDQFLSGANACNASVSETVGATRTLGASLNWGIAEATYGTTTEADVTRTYVEGSDILRRAFGLENTGQYIEIERRQFCGASPRVGEQLFDIYLNGQLFGSIRPGVLPDSGYEIDVVSKRAKITCRAHRDAYQSYLQDELDVPAEWLPLVASLTARWARGFVQFEDCG